MSDLSPEAVRDGHLFRCSLPMRVKLDRIGRAVGPTHGMTCLEVGFDNGIMSYHMRQNGGTWHTVTTSEAAARSARDWAGDNVHVLKRGALPFKKKDFDIVVAADMLERVENPAAFIADCHRLMKPDSRLVLTAANRKKWTLMRLLRNALASPGYESRQESKYPGFTETELFGLLKDGFDLHGMHKYRGFFVEAVNLILQAMIRRRAQHDELAGMRLHSMAKPFFFLAAQLDMLLFFVRGHCLLAVAKRRPWLPRKTPVLTDGRSIPEAVLNTLGSDLQ